MKTNTQSYFVSVCYANALNITENRRPTTRSPRKYSDRWACQPLVTEYRGYMDEVILEREALKLPARERALLADSLLAVWMMRLRGKSRTPGPERPMTDLPPTGGETSRRLTGRPF